ncbi:hypothetical protein LDENG_00160890 [Lucifuga dentata]|nr:hypothetical protein LDENG_00160890 [Lucifuga dentata]
MDDLETPYDDENPVEYVDCMVCNKSIRGDTLYKIHLTTAGHMKKEDTLVAQGCAVRKHTVPDFVDFGQYLNYLKIDEPIIGLNFLEEVPCISSDPQPGPRYKCKLCDLQANLPNMVHHVIGRKHRQKYLQMKRPDLVNWDTSSMMNRSAKLIRAKAEVVERQDGQGTPKPMKKNRNVGKSNIFTVPPKQRQNIGQNIPHRFTQQDEMFLYPELRNSWDKYSLSGGSPRDYQNKPPFHPDDSYMSARAERQIYSRVDPLSRDLMTEDPRKTDYRESDTYRQERMKADFPQEYQEEYVEDPQGRDFYESQSVSSHSFRKEMPHRQAHCADQYAEEGPLYRRPYPESDPLKQFYSDEVRRGQVRSAENQPSPRVFSEDTQAHWSQDREYGSHEDLNGADRQGSSETKTRRVGILNIIHNDVSHDKNHPFQLISDYQQTIKESHQEEANHGLNRTGPPNSQKPLEFSRTLSSIPEPFRRFLEGPANNETLRKRKRKSQFSDATEEEVRRAKEMFNDEYGPPSQTFHSHPRTVTGPLNTDVCGSQTPDPYAKSQSPHYTELYQRGDLKPSSEFPTDKGGVFDMLKNIEIENVEEADFLKKRLCSVLKEFQAKKFDKQNSQDRADYSDFKQDPQISERHQYERLFSEDPEGRELEGRQPEEFHLEEVHRGRGWERHEQKPDRHQYERPFSEDPEGREPEEFHLEEVRRGRGWQRHDQKPDAQMQEYNHPVLGESQHLSRSRHEEMFASPEMNWPTHAPHPDEPVRYPDRLQESMQPRDYRPVTNKFFDPRSSASSYHIERGYGKQRHSSSLDKITSTLLELVARK